MSVEHTDREELVTLRVSLVRVAQVASVSLAHLHLPDNAEYSQIHRVASTQERGWNRLAGMIIGAVEDLRQFYDTWG